MKTFTIFLQNVHSLLIDGLYERLDFLVDELSSLLAIWLCEVITAGTS